MHLSEETLAIIGSALVPVLGLVAWLTRAHVQGKNERITELQQESKSLKAEVAQAEAHMKGAVIERDAARAELIPLKVTVSSLQKQLQSAHQKADAAADKAKKIYAAGAREHQAKNAAEKQTTELKAQVSDLELGRAKILAELATEKDARNQAEAAKEKAEKEKARAVKRAHNGRKKLQVLQDQFDGVVKQDGRVWCKPVPNDAPTFVRLAGRSMPIVSVLNLKGGVGKTTITANLGGYLGNTAGKRVLMIDADHQRSLSQLLLSSEVRKAAAAAGRTLQHFLSSLTHNGDEIANTAECVPNLANCSLVTNTEPLAFSGGQSLDDLEMHLMGQWLVNPRGADARFLLRNALHSDAVRGSFDFVLIDCPPRLTTACINALAASDFVLIPVQAETVSMRSVQHLLIRLRELREAGLLANLRVLGMVASMTSGKVDEKGSHEGKLLAAASEAAQRPEVWGKPVGVFRTKLIRGHQYAEASKELNDRIPLRLAIDFPSIHRQYQELAKEIEERINENVGVASVSS